MATPTRHLENNKNLYQQNENRPHIINPPTPREEERLPYRYRHPLMVKERY